ncbi:MAG: anion permease [Cyanobacteria bacterium]|nr:anion permease [Cyanobacteriota bacterium]
MSRTRGLAALVVLYIIIGELITPPDGITRQGWRQTAIFIGVIAGMVTEPIHASALVLIGLTAWAVTGTPMPEVLGGYAQPSVWLVLVAMLIAKMMLDCGLARRIALLFVRMVGKTSLGVAYALQMTDVTLASGVPSITARSAGMVLPVGRSIAELFDSRPDHTRLRLGAYLVAAMYQGSAVACAMFITGQASNLLGASLALKLANIQVTAPSWFMAAIVPGLLSCLVVPWITYRVLTPEVTHTPEAPAFARDELKKMGRLSRSEWITLLVFAGVGITWLTTVWHRIDPTLVALAGLAVLLATGTMTWQTAAAERSAWDVFIWYGGMLRMGELLNNTGTTRVFAEWVAGMFVGIPWQVVLIAILIIFFYTHYFFASITAHMLAMFPPFVAVLIGIGVPPLLAVYSLLCLANLTAGLTHYGTTTGPILFGTGYVTRAEWWKVGFFVSIANVLIWLTAGFAWWKFLGFW